MTYDVDNAGRSRLSQGAPDQADRILVAICIVLWLTALGAGVAAIVALVGLARGHATTGGASETPWLLYSVIGVSAAVIIGAIPLLVRARRTAVSSGPGLTPSSRPGTGASDDVSAPRLQPFGAPVIRRLPVPPTSSRVAFPTAAVDQVWLRFTAITAGAIGAGMTGIGVATYLMASQHDSAAWSVYAVAAIITLALPASPWFFLRQLHTVLEAPQPTLD